MPHETLSFDRQGYFNIFSLDVKFFLFTDMAYRHIMDPEVELMDFHIILKNLRKKNRKTQADLAALLQIDQSTYAHYESGRRTPDIEKLKKLACYYGLRDEILGVGTDEDSGIPRCRCMQKITAFPGYSRTAPLTFHGFTRQSRK